METEVSTPSYSRKKIASVLIGMGILVFLSSLIVNPWVGRLYRGSIINFSDVMLTYFLTAIVISLVIFACAFAIRATASKAIEQVSVFVIMLALIVLSDRLLLAVYGLPLWIADIESHYKHRPGIVRSWSAAWAGESEDKLIRINKYGFHDDDFPLEKATNEFRGLILGDSVTMGHGVVYEDTFSNQLENILKEKTGGQRTFQIINSGVQGYATYQEYDMLVDSLKFKPDFAAVQFCLNDLTAPFVVDTKFGGTGLDYHGVAQNSSRFFSYFLNETGYGRTVQKFQNRGKSVETERRWELYNVVTAAESTVDDPTFAEGWKITLASLDKMYDTSRENNIRIVLLICPHVFQMVDERFQQSSKILKEHAKTKGVDVIDFTEVFDKLIFDRNAIGQLDKKGFSFDEIERLFEKRTRKYFLDYDHFTPEGHRVVAMELYKYLADHYTF